MELVFCCEAVFKRCSDTYYSATSSFGMSLWQRYLSVFDRISLIVRVEETDSPLEYEIDKSINVIPLPRYKGLVGTIGALQTLKSILKPQAIEGRAYILRVPGQIGATFSKVLHKAHIPYGVEVVGDPWDVMESIGGRLSFILKRIGLRQLRKTVKNAGAALYVTEHQLQKRYPVKGGIRTFVASNVNVDKDFFVPLARNYPQREGAFGLISVGSLEQLYKAPDIVIKAIKILKDKGRNIHLKWFGGGKYIGQLKSMAAELDVSDTIEFLGNVDRKTIEQSLIEGDLFVHVSRTEGLPRAIIEAMAKALPVIGSTVGGIPELIDDNSIIEPNDENALASKIIQFMDDEEMYENSSLRNLREAAKYEDSILACTRNKFYNQVKIISQR